MPSKILGVVGLLAMLVGLLDPLEGSVGVVVGAALCAIGARIGCSRYTTVLYSGLILVTIGVAAMFAASTFGGIRRESLVWWGLIIGGYPLGFFVGVTGAILRLIEAFHRPATPLEAA
jgi:hypothetical protein